MIRTTDLLAMLNERATDPERATTEAVLLRAAIDRFDDFLAAIDMHIAEDHAGDPCSRTVSETLDAVRGRLRVELDHVDAALRVGDR